MVTPLLSSESIALSAPLPPHLYQQELFPGVELHFAMSSKASNQAGGVAWGASFEGSDEDLTDPESLTTRSHRAPDDA